MGVIGWLILTCEIRADTRHVVDESDLVVGMPCISSWVKELQKRLLHGELRGSKIDMEKQ